jgi:hypothetical protein
MTNINTTSGSCQQNWDRILGYKEGLKVYPSRQYSLKTFTQNQSFPIKIKMQSLYYAFIGVQATNCLTGGVLERSKTIRGV